ncbi:MAG: fibronectin type III domain-containing protein [bacterium]
MKTRRATTLALVPFMLGMILLAGCKGGTSPEALSPDSSNSAFKFPELHDALAAEFTRLGIDPDKVPAKVASGDANAVFDLTLTVDDPDGEGPTPASGVTLKWTERMLGDYDQNGLVNASDITPLGQNFQQSVIYDDPFSHNGLEYWPTGNPDDGGSGSANWRRARVDGNDDGLVGLSDITSIAQHWNEQLSGYVVQMAVNRGDGELNWTDVDSGNGIAPSIARPSVNNAAPVRYELYIPLGEAQFAHHFRVLPFDAGTDERGALSNRADFYPVDQGDTTPPYWLDTVGVQQLVPSSEQIRVEFGNAEDSQSPPVSYRVYWEETTEGSLDPFDYGSAQSEDVTESPFTITGLTNEQYYRVAVRAVDSAEPPNEEQNLKVLGALVEPRDVYPPEWQDSTGLVTMFYGDGRAVLGYSHAIDNTADENGTWSSGPVRYRIYYGPGQTPDFDNATVIEIEDQGAPYNYSLIEDLDTEVDRWFVVRAVDSADPENEDGNLEVQLGKGVIVRRYELPGPGPDVPAGVVQVEAELISNPQATVGGYAAVYQDPNNLQVYASFHEITPEGFIHRADLDLGSFEEEIESPAVRMFSLDKDGKFGVFMNLPVEDLFNQFKLQWTREGEDPVTYSSDTRTLRLLGTNYNDEFWYISQQWNGQVIDGELKVYSQLLGDVASEPFFTETESESLWQLHNESCLVNGDVALFVPIEIEDIVTWYLGTISGQDGSIGLENVDYPSLEYEPREMYGFGVDEPIRQWFYSEIAESRFFLFESDSESYTTPLFDGVKQGGFSHSSLIDFDNMYLEFSITPDHWNKFGFYRESLTMRLIRIEGNEYLIPRMRDLEFDTSSATKIPLKGFIADLVSERDLETNEIIRHCEIIDQ